MKNKFSLIGVWDYTVIVTYISLISSVVGMANVVNGRFKIAITCLAFSGLCDMFDGKIARTKKDRTEKEKLFGIELDSLCDVVCFGVYPALIAYEIGLRGWFGIPICCLYVLCGVIRLGYFNVMEMTGGNVTEEGEKAYHGLPITSISIIFPIVFLLRFCLEGDLFTYVIATMMLLCSMAFVVDFPFKKPTNKELAIIVLFVAGVIFVALYFMPLRFPLMIEV